MFPRSKIIFALVAVIVVAASVVSGQACQGYTRLEFHANQETEGLLSYITAPNRTVRYTDKLKFPIPVVVNVVSPEIIDPLSDVGGTQLDTRLDGLSISVSPKPDKNIRLSGQVADIVRGRCIFKDLTIFDTPLGESIVLLFKLTLPNGTVLAIETGPVQPVDAVSQTIPQDLRFANYGYIIRENQALTLPLVRTGSSISPLIRLEPLSPAGETLNTKSYTVKATCTSGTLNPDNWPFSPGQPLNVALNLENADPATAPICSFNVSTVGWTRSLQTGPITLVSLKQRNRFMFFDKDNPFLMYNNYGGSGKVEGALGVPLPPIVIKLYTSSFEFDSSNTGLVITAHSIQAELRGAEAVVQRGVATFSQLRFVGSVVDRAVITFVAGPQGALPVDGAVLYSGPVKVAITTVKKYLLDMSPLSGIQANEPKKIKLQGREFKMPNLVVVVKDSAHQFDSTANGILLSITLVPPVATVPNPSQTVVNGLAAWSDLTLQANSKLTFRIVISDESGAIQNQLSTGAITVEPDRYTDPAEASALFFLCTDPQPVGMLEPPCIFGLRFSSQYSSFSSHVYEENQPLFTTVGGTVPTIRVELTDIFGVAADRTGLTEDNVPAVFAMTGIDPRNEELLVRGGARDLDTGGRNEGIFKNGVYEFSCLEFASVPTGLIRITFAAYNVSRATGKILNKLEGINALRTGFVSVTASAVANYALRFDNANSLIIYEGQISTGAANIALPTITVLIVDSNNEPVTRAAGMVVAVEPTSGEIDKSGAREVVNNGKATFSNIKFTDTGNDPKMIFRVFQTTDPAQGKSVSSGVFVLAALPIPYFEIAFAPSRGEFSDVTFQFQEMTFATFAVAQFRVSIYVRDSAHQVHSSAGGNVIKIESTSAQSQIENRAGSTIVQLDPTCNCANFTTAIGRPSSATGIYVKYRVAEGPALLKGKELVVGPIIIEEELRKVSTCEATLITPVILGEFKTGSTAFATKSAGISQSIATKMGLESTRVTILPDVQDIKRRDFDTGGEWSGTLAKIIFSNPFPTSTNMRTSSQLADEFVRLRSTCDTGSSSSGGSGSSSGGASGSASSSGLSEMQTAYFASDVKTCDLKAFRASLDAAHRCAAELLIPMCQCYDEGPAAIWGFPCQEDKNAETLLTELCSATVDCAEASITATCAGLVSALTTNLGWLYALLATVTAIVMIVMVMRKKGVTFGKQKLKLSFFSKLRGYRADPYEVKSGEDSRNVADEDD